jgi:hypothetical protein
MNDEFPELDEPFDWSTRTPPDAEPVVFADDDVPFDPFTPDWVVS